MKNLIIYYFAILLPMPLLILSAQIDSVMFTILLFFYIIYRGIIDGKRLIEKGVIPKSDLWKMICIPLYSMYFFKELYFEA